MSLSASIPALKSRAKKLTRAERIPLCQALDRVAAAEGYSSWSLLVAKMAARKTDISEHFGAGDLVLLGARPGQGKTIFALELLIGSVRRGGRGWFFSLQNDALDVDAMFERMGARRASLAEQLVFAHSDEICGQHVIERVGDSRADGCIIVIDYLQLLDQRRKSPSLQQQVSDLAAFAKHTGRIIILISQIRSSFDAKAKRLPTINDIRLLDNLDTSLFDKLVFMHEGRVRVH